MDDDRIPIVAGDRVVVVTAISVDVVKALSDDFCHLVTAPVLPDKVKDAAEVPEQIVWLALNMPPTDTGLTFIKTEDELAVAQVPFLITALKYVDDVNAPIVGAANVEVVFTISDGVVKALSEDFCHFTIVPE